VILLSADCNAPALPILLPLAHREDRSLGRLWRQATFTQKDILNQCVSGLGDAHIALLGYDLDDIPDGYTEEMAADLFVLLCQAAEHIIVDCVTDPKHDLLSRMVLGGRADSVFKVFHGNVKSLAQIRQLRHGFGEGLYYEQINVCNQVQPWQDIQNFYDGIGNVPYRLPYLPELDMFYCHGRLGEDLSGQGKKDSDAVMAKILEEVIELA